MHFLVQAVPKLAPGQMIRTVKSLTAREVLKKCPHVEERLWGGGLWADGYYVCTVGQHGTEDTVRAYVKNQGRQEEYKQLRVQQLSLC